ncbi:MAG: hypothetical protein GQ582_09160 [Methyloprofundus sp.]|nr:hypothetical protein [Methyloprofundus sp.]
MAFIMQPAQADIDSDCNLILTVAQQVYPQLFASDPETQNIGPWCFRHYTQSDLYLGIFRGGEGFKKEGVYGLGDIFGDSPSYIGQTNDIIQFLEEQTTDRVAAEVCDTREQPKGLTSTRDGDTTHIKTEGVCLAITGLEDICDAAPAIDENGDIIATGIHVFTHSDVSHFQLNGFSMPKLSGLSNFFKVDISNPFDFLEDEIAEQTSCIIHAPESFVEHKIKADICMDFSEQLGEFADIPGVTLPLTVELKSETTAERVDDCFKTDASTISNLETGERWVNKKGEFEKIN